MSSKSGSKSKSLHASDHLNSTSFLQIILFSFQAAKLPLCLLVAFSALFGFTYYDGGLNSLSFLVFAAVLLLACGAASLNSYQERESDAFFQRTSSRPLVVGNLSVPFVVGQSCFLLAAGLILLFTLGKNVFYAGVTACILYNFIYTPLKSVTLYALLPGATSGAIPPVIGWLAAGGNLLTYKALCLFFFLFLWQIPHFLLVLLNHQNDYDGTKRPNLLHKLTESGVRRIFLPWVSALASVMILFAVTPSSLPVFGKILIIINSGVLLFSFYKELLVAQKMRYVFLFKHLNVSIFLQMLIIFISSIKL